MGKDGYRSPQTGGVLDRIAPVVTLIGALLSTAGFVLAFTLAGPVNGATVNGVEVIGGEMVSNQLLFSQKIFYFHMPVAVTSMVMIGFVAYFGIRFLQTRDAAWDERARIAAGIALVRAQKQNGAQLLATGEMGIGNTTTSSAVASVLLGRPVAEMTGRGAGLSDAGLQRKIDAIERGIARNHPDAADPLGVLAALGGFDIAGLCGVFLGGALERLPIVMDGFISGVAALCAVRLCPAAEKAVFASHVSSEPAAHIVLDALCKKPLITAELHLGEGTGAVASLPLWDMALAVYNGCYSFAEGGITPYTPQC